MGAQAAKKALRQFRKALSFMVRPARFELATYGFVVRNGGFRWSFGEIARAIPGHAVFGVGAASTLAEMLPGALFLAELVLQRCSSQITLRIILSDNNIKSASHVMHISSLRDQIELYYLLPSPPET